MTEDTSPSTATASLRMKKYGLRIALALLLIGVLGFLVMPPLVKWLLVDQLAAALHRPVSIEGLRINPYTLSLQVDGLAIQEKGGGDKVAGFEQLFVNLEGSSLFRLGPVISELKLVGPELSLVRLPDGRFNVSDLIDEFMARPPSTEPTPRFSVNNIQITGGKVDFDDRMVGEKQQLSEVNLTLPFVSSLPNSVEIFVEPAFSASLNGAPVAIQGRSKPFSAAQESELAVDLRAVHIAPYLDYLPLRLPIQLVSGFVDGELKLVFRRGEDDHPSLSLSGSATLRDLVVKDTAGAPLLSLQQLHVALARIDPLQRVFAIERVSLDAPEIHARVSPQGTINWIDFFSQELAARSPPAAAGVTAVEQPAVPVSWSLGEGRVSGGALHWLDESHGKPFNARIEGLDVAIRNLDGKGASPAKFELAMRFQGEPWIKGGALSVTGGQLDLAKRRVLIDQLTSRGTQLLLRRAANGSIDFVQPPLLRTVTAARKDPGGAWEITVARNHAEEIGLRFEDAAVSPPVTHAIEGLRFDGENLSTVAGSTARLKTSFRLNRKGEVELTGSVRALPLDADLKLAVRTLELLPLQPYVTEHLNAELTRGLVSADGVLQLRQSGSGGLDPAALGGGFSGEVTIGDFQAVDKINSADFMKWKSLHLGRIDLRLQPASLAVGEVALSDFFARVIVSREGKLNLLQIVRQDGKAQPAALPAAPPVVASEGKAVAPVGGAAGPRMPISIARITLQGGDVRFSDNFIKPSYSAHLRKIGGTISGLSSAPDTAAKVDLRGSYDNIAPLTVSGQLNPLSPTPRLDLQAEVKGIEMTSLSPYSGKYAGYAIEKGKMSLFVKYRIENRQLTAENRIFLDQLTFGEPVASPDATKLPVTLAVALLKNRNGEIDINLPISGSLDDPEFSIGGLIVRVIVNVLLKAVTSPFALLGSVFGGGEELSTIDFAVGEARLTAEAEKRLDTLAKALIDRPALRLEIEGRADLQSDPEGLKRHRLQSKVRALKREELTKKGIESGSLDSVEVDAREYPALLERVYRAEKFPKPRNLVGMVKGLPVDEMEKLILANTVADEEELRDLADRRAKAVFDGLLAREVPAERLFLLPVKLVASDGKADAAAQARESRVALSLK
ncbi:DUF748 domain-containing protein [Accumulibacter sp.]|uniref:DUF748 domain-containing protein n=1 Tax=Accumulibacter sp. TaxID=2053492 RepID=UPI0025FC9DEC|nr:DUF748 domain-containing protein [Accumulibacter sp.]MCM8613184.1 DUF748 domain-containing protein [Accumulibacter sp.]MCM8636529.1 DUF748 domain-containing protein [Accumulibacter sp.]MCM8640237.1 DUF748 domain-containing protein [Accumulibacter sp.]